MPTEGTRLVRNRAGPRTARERKCGSTARRHAAGGHHWSCVDLLCQGCADGGAAAPGAAAECAACGAPGAAGGDCARCGVSSHELQSLQPNSPTQPPGGDDPDRWCCGDSDCTEPACLQRSVRSYWHRSPAEVAKDAAAADANVRSYWDGDATEAAAARVEIAPPAAQPRRPFEVNPFVDPVRGRNPFDDAPRDLITF
ncbi:hypothetical protein M885DRAFT_538860 [Pelagophyceae sp. CCMP2097]|nr:hypothetical protein M885DRAFT_538860 [Pelagophyceae sp. CCMP2097]